MEYHLPKSECLVCNSRYTRKGIGRHIQSCLKKKFEHTTRKDGTYYLLHVHPDFTKDYFLYLLATKNTRLGDLDTFLRAIWLECCGHLSAFSYNRYDDIPMNTKISRLGYISKPLIYQYDFGSTTELHIKIVGIYSGPRGLKSKIVILARNAQPIIPCDECSERPAVEICTDCQWIGGGWLCEECAQEHPCGEEMFLPVCNSPRTGVCAYTGEQADIRTDKILKDFLKQLQDARQ